MNFYKLEKEHDHYRQVAIKDNKDLGIAAGDVGGKFYLSNKKNIRNYQIRDLSLAARGQFAKNTWLDQNSSLAGDYRVPQDSTFINSHVDINSNHDAAIINYSNFKNTNVAAKDCDVSIDSSNFNHSNLNLNGANVLAANSNFDHAKIHNKGEDQLYQNADVKNATIDKFMVAKNETVSKETEGPDFAY